VKVLVDSKYGDKDKGKVDCNDEQKRKQEKKQEKERNNEEI